MAKSTDFTHVTFGKSIGDCKSEQMRCMTTLDAKDALFKYDVLRSKFLACYQGFTAYPGMLKDVLHHATISDTNHEKFSRTL